MLSPTSVLEIPTARPARRYDSPVEKDRPDRVQADLQRKRWGAAHPGRARRKKTDEADGQPGQHVGGQRRTRAV
jgi:hypothetical protein